MDEARHASYLFGDMRRTMPIDYQYFLHATDYDELFHRQSRQLQKRFKMPRQIRRRLTRRNTTQCEIEYYNATYVEMRW